MLYGKFFIRKWAGEGYDAAYYVGAMVMIPYIVPLIQNIGIEIQRAKNMHKFRSIIYFIIAFANLGISIPLGKYYGAVGTTFGTTLSTIIGNIILMNWYYHIKKVGLNIIEFIKKYDSTIDFAYHSCNNRVSVRRVFPVVVGRSGRAVSRNLCNITLFDWIE